VWNLRRKDNKILKGMLGNKRGCLLNQHPFLSDRLDSVSNCLPLFSFDKIYQTSGYDSALEHYVTGHQEPKTDEEMWSFFNDLTSIGEILDREVNLDGAVTRFNERRGTMPTEEQLEYNQNFVSGNQKNWVRSNLE
jgi:hypothetical protein